jgi:hypothetical protein
MNEDAGILIASKLMIEFAGTTGLLPPGDAQRRYLWTDAFAVCNFLGLYRETNDETFKGISPSLVSQVHEILGRHRPDGRQSGWISGLDRREGELHPTIGGLRIGKQLNERAPNDPIDDDLEWERDGQYFHYLTKWMHALSRMTSVTANPVYRRWAVELAKTAYARFTYDDAQNRKRMYWKMSIDLSRPLVASMGHHDPLDGLITCSELQAGLIGDMDASFDLSDEINGFAGICRGKDWTTDDPLGIGALLSDALRAAQLLEKGRFSQKGLPGEILKACSIGLGVFSSSGLLRAPASRRLAFRELGLSIGLHALERLEGLIAEGAGGLGKDREVRREVENLLKQRALAGQIEDFWLETANRSTPLFMEHRDINTVMLATSLAPGGFLML